LNKIAQIAANELAGRKIRINTVSPGPIQTPGLDTVATPEAKSHLAASTALQRLGKAEEIANMVLFLASDEAAFITGADFTVDGGALTYMKK
jgi:NAD(P)-dependent dehydrogenase (short-subunit alcohol dehydrogenase family)